MRQDVYENTHIFKEMMKPLHDQQILKCVFKPSDKVLLCNSRLHLFSMKLSSWWIGQFIVKNVYPYPHGAIENEICHVFKVKGKCLKYFLEFPKHTEEFQDLVDPLPST